MVEENEVKFHLNFESLAACLIFCSTSAVPAAIFMKRLRKEEFESRRFTFLV